MMAAPFTGSALSLGGAALGMGAQPAWDIRSLFSKEETDGAKVASPRGFGPDYSRGELTKKEGENVSSLIPSEETLYLGGKQVRRTPRSVVSEAVVQSLEGKLGYTFTDKNVALNGLLALLPGDARKLTDKLEFLGDAAVEVYALDYLYKKYPSIEFKSLDHMQRLVKSRSAQAEIARELGLPDLFISDRPRPETVESIKEKVLADSVESVLGSVYWDGGFKSVSKVMEKLLKPRLDSAPPLPNESRNSPLGNVGMGSVLLGELERFIGRDFKDKKHGLSALDYGTAESNNQSGHLKFLGRAVLVLALRSWLMKYRGNEDVGDYNLTEQKLLSNDALAQFAQSANVAAMLPGYRGIAPDDKSLARFVARIAGAVYLDAGWDAAYQLAKRWFERKAYGKTSYVPG